MENTEDYLDLLFQQSPDPKPTKNTATREEMIAFLEANMEKYGITNPYMKNAMMGIILSEGGFKGVGENMYYTTPGRLAEVWSTFSTYKNSKGQTVRAPKGQGSKYANELAKSGKYIKNPEALGDFIYGNRMGNIEPGEGYKYRGRGLNQLTGKKNYKAIGDKLGVDLVNNPDLLIQDPNLQAEVAVRFLFDAVDKSLPALVKRNPKKYGKRFPNLDYNNYTNQEDATYLLTSANAGFGTPLKAETLNKRLAQAKKFNYHLNDRPAEEVAINNVEPIEESEINSIVSAKEAEAIAPFDQWDESMNTYDTENTEKIQVPFDQEDIKYSADNYENTIAKYNTNNEGFDSAPVNNLDENQQKRNKLFNTEVLKGLRMPQINRGQSLFGRGSLFGADKKKYGGTVYPKYFANGGPGDGEDEEEDGEGTTSNALTGGLKMANFILNASKLKYARAMQKKPIPEQGDLSNAEYYKSLSDADVQNLKYTAEMDERDIGVEKGHTSMVQNNMGDIAKKLSLPGTSMKYDYDYLGIPWMGNTNSWFHKMPDTKNPGFFIDPYSCQGVACAIGRKAGAVNAADYVKGKKGDPWTVETGSGTVDNPKVHKAKGMFPMPTGTPVQKGDIYRMGHKTPGGTDHNIVATDSSYEDAYGYQKIPSGYASHWSDGVKSHDWDVNEENHTIFRYLRNLPEIEKKAAKSRSLYNSYMFSKNRPNPAMKTYKGTEGPNHRLDYVNKNTVVNKKPSVPFTIPQRNYATGGTLEKPCPPGKIFSVEFDECVTYKVWEQIAQSMSTDFDMDAVKKTNENFYDTTEWFKQYYNSPKYKEMVKSSVEASGSPGNVEEKTQNIITSRDAQLETVPPIQILKPNSPYNSFNNDPIPPLGYSNSVTGKITMIDHPDYPGGFRQGTVGHELSHSTDRPGYSWGDNTRLMPQSDVDYIESRKPKYIGDTRKYWNNKPFYDWLKKNDINAFRKTQKKTLDWTNYIGEPTETRARLNDIRKFAQSKGIYDPFTEEFEYKHYKELLKQKKTDIKGLKELQEAFGDDEIIWMFNHISKNKNNNTDDKEGIA